MKPLGFNINTKRHDEIWNAFIWEIHDGVWKRVYRGIVIEINDSYFALSNDGKMDFREVLIDFLDERALLWNH